MTRMKWNEELDEIKTRQENKEMQYNALKMMESGPEDQDWLINSDFW